jgi:hypothetical protein
MRKRTSNTYAEEEKSSFFANVQLRQAICRLAKPRRRERSELTSGNNVTYGGFYGLVEGLGKRRGGVEGNKVA